MEGVKLLTKEEQVVVAANLKKMSDDALEKAITSFEELPTCLRLAKEEFERRKNEMEDRKCRRTL
jgi:hypothetical protein